MRENVHGKYQIIEVSKGYWIWVCKKCEEKIKGVDHVKKAGGGGVY
jgi:hypothetical protein